MELYYKSSAVKVIKKFTKEEKQIFKEIISELKESPEAGGFLKGSLKDFLIFKQNNNIRDKIIAPDSTESRDEAKKFLTSQPLSEYRFVTDWWQSNAEKWIWRDSVLNLIINENATNLIVIKSQALSEIERFNFNQIWQTLPKETD